VFSEIAGPKEKVNKNIEETADKNDQRSYVLAECP